MKGTKSHRERKNGHANEQQRERNAAKNATRSKQVFLGVDEKTGFGLGWTRDKD